MNAHDRINKRAKAVGLKVPVDLDASTYRLVSVITEVLAEMQVENTELLEALEQIINLDPEYDSENGLNEWGEAECFNLAQKIAKAVIAKAKGE